MEPNQGFNLKWAEFHSNLQETYSQLRSNQHFTDVTLACEEGQQLNAHKVILSASSLLFDGILKQNKHPNPIVYLSKVKRTYLESILDFIYFGEVQIRGEDLEGFLAVTDELKIKGLTGKHTNDESNAHNPNLESSKGMQIKEENVDQTDLLEGSQSEEESSNNLYTCNLCGKAIATLRALQKHCYKYHEGESANMSNETVQIGDHSCNICGKVSISKGGLQKHHARNHAERYISSIYNTADLKEKSSNQTSDTLKSNIEVSIPIAFSTDDLSETTPTFNCELCDKRSTTKAGLNKHKIRYHTAARMRVSIPSDDLVK